jgi:hypothetical protein
MTGLMSDQYVRKFEEKPKLPTRTLPEIRKAMDLVLNRHRYSADYRTKDEPFNITALVNAVMAWYGTQTEEEQDRIAKAGVDLCNERLASPDEIPLAPPAKPKGRK